MLGEDQTPEHRARIARIQRRLFLAMKDYLAANGLQISPEDGMIIPFAYCRNIHIPIELKFKPK